MILSRLPHQRQILSKRFKKITTGIAVAREIGLEKIREYCPIFNDWLTVLENTNENRHESDSAD